MHTIVGKKNTETKLYTNYSVQRKKKEKRHLMTRR